MMSCQEYEQQISMLLDGELPEAQRADLEAHLRTCRNCADTYAEFTFLSQALRDPEPPADLAERVLSQLREEQVIDLNEQRRGRRSWRTAAAIAACFAVLLGVAYFAGPGVWNHSVPTGITLFHPSDNAQRALEADVSPAESGTETAETDGANPPLLMVSARPLSQEQSEKALALLENAAEAEAPEEDHAPACAAVAPGEDGSDTVTTLWIDGEDVVFTEDGEHFFKTEDAADALQSLLNAGE